MVMSDPLQDEQRALIEVSPAVEARLRDPRLVLGWVLCITGAIAVFVGYWGVSDTLDPGKQLPYIISGGIGGVFLLGVGAALIFQSDMAEGRREVRELRTVVDQMQSHISLLVERSAPTAPDGPEPADNGSPRRTTRSRSKP
jgi:hypothetical protein